MPTDRPALLSDRPVRSDALLLALLHLALVVPYALGHVDDVDSVTYRVITRHLLEDGTPFQLRFLSSWFPSFHEHPPFMFWLWATASRVAGEWTFAWISLLCGLGTVLATYFGAVPLVGRRAAFLAGLFLLATESFFRTHANTTLDPPLTLAFTASAMWLLNAGGRWRWLVAGALASGVGALVKGPPAWGAPAAAFLGLAILGRRRELALHRWVVVTLLAVGPLALFFAYDHLALGGAWWRGYVLKQVVASAIGANLDGHTERFYLLETTLGRFPHGIPFVAVALLLGRGAALRARLAFLAWAAVVVGGYSIPARAWPWYLLPAYPALSVVAGAGLGDLLGRLSGDVGLVWARRIAGAGAAITLAALPACTTGGRRPLGIGACVFGPLPEQARVLARERVALLAPDVWNSSKNEVFTFAEHTRLDVVGVSDAEALAARRDLDVALVRTARTPVPPGWSPVAVYREWTLATRGPG